MEKNGLYQMIITTTKKDDLLFNKVDKSIWKIEHGKDELFNLLKRNRQYIIRFSFWKVMLY